MYKLVIGILILFIYSVSFATEPYLNQLHGDALYRARNHHSGNQVRMTWHNFGYLGGQSGMQGTFYSGEWPINSGQFQAGNSQSFVGTEITVFDSLLTAQTGDTVYTNITPCVWSETWNQSLAAHDDYGRFQGFEPLPGFYNQDNPAEEKSTMSHQPITWPPYWPDKMEDAVDPGWRGSWNGYFGKNEMQADQESYCVMDDYQYNKRVMGFKLPQPLSSQPTRPGLGFRNSMRGLQWSNPDAEDVLFIIHEIHNFSEIDMEKTVFGMNAGPYMGGLIGGSGNEHADDCATFNRETGITINYDYDDIGQSGYSPVPFLGYAFLESPGNPYDGIDNDGDGNAGTGDGHLITERDFEARTIQVGDQIVVIDYQSPYFERRVTTMPARGIEIRTRLVQKTILPNTPLVEVPQNGVDDNLNGLIDENDGAEIADTEELFYLYIYHPKYNTKNYLAKDWLTGQGLNNLMIDERRDDGIDNDRDWNSMSDDVGLDGSAGTQDFGEGDGIPTPGQGELPGEPNIDRVDVDESDQIGLTGFVFYPGAGALDCGDDPLIWSMATPGRFEGEYLNIDADYIFSTGYFPLQPNQRESFSISVLFGEDEFDIVRNKQVVQSIYDANYNFAVAPRLPTVWAVPGNGKVTLYWDEAAEYSKDRYLGEYDFEGYKIYRSTDPSFSDAGIITDGSGYAKYTKPLAVFDKIDGVAGFFPLTFGTGVQFFLGNDVGLAHTYVDSPLVNGQRYFYAVTAFDKGDPDKKISPSETSKYVAVDAGGNITTAQNVAVVVPRASSLGYIPAGFTEEPRYISGKYVGNGVLRAKIIDPALVEDNKSYRVEFFDTGTDGIDNDYDWQAATDDVGADGQPNTNDVGEGDGKPTVGEPNLDSRDIDEYVPETMGMKLLKMTDANQSVEVGRVTFKEYTIVNDTQKIVIKNLYDDADKDATTLTTRLGPFEFFLHNPRPGLLNMITDNFRVYDGVRWSANIEWSSAYELEFQVWDRFSYESGRPFPRQYQIIFYDEIVGASVDYEIRRPGRGGMAIGSVKTNFKVQDFITGEEIPFAFRDRSRDVAPGIFSSGDEMWLLEAIGDSLAMGYYVRNTSREDTTFIKYHGQALSAGDTLYLLTERQFSANDRFEFSVSGEKTDPNAAQNTLDKIRVVPNPYVVTAGWEPKNPYGSGYGHRFVNFINLPQACTIRIYAMDGTLVRTLEHFGSASDGDEEWDLRTKDQMDVAYGLYIYHVDAPGIGETIGKLVLIK